MKTLVRQQIKTSTRNFITLVAIIFMATFAGAQTPIAASTQFDIIGFIQSASLGGPGAGAHQGGSITVNGHVVTVPAETIVILPANALTWQELFAQAPAPYTNSATGMAISDSPTPLTTYEAHVVGNRVNDVYIAGLIWIAQQGVNSGQGFINSINYANGEIRVGGVIGNGATGTRVRLNDPLNAGVGTGRYGRPMTADQRFTVDQDNPTVRSVSGFPMCIPRVLADPSIAGNPDDALCPLSQRPAAIAPATGYAAFILTNDPVALPGVPPDATKQAPFEVGDYVTYAGTLVKDGTNPTAGPWPGIASTYISAHTLVNNVGIYTWPGTNPAYVAVDVSFIGTGGLTVIGVNEAAIMTRIEGFSTDTVRGVHLYGIDLNPTTGATSDRDWGTIGVDPGPPKGAATGRWRFRPPCLLNAPDPTNMKDCTGPPSNSFLPPTRELRAVIQGAFTAPITPTSPVAANGIVWGQYHTPIAEYRFPENLPGKPVIENNFNTMDFLARGGYSSSTGVVVGVLNPWPSDTSIGACNPATANAGGLYTVPSGGTVTLNGSGTGDPTLAFLWTAPAQGTLSALNIAGPVYTAPVVAAQTPVPLQLTVSNSCGTSVANTTVTIDGSISPTVNQVAAMTVFSGAASSFPVSGTDPNVPPALPLVFTVTQTGAPALIGLTVTPGPNPPGTGATVNFTAPTLPIGQVTSPVINLTITATNSAGVVSAPVMTTVTVKPLVDVVSVTGLLEQYRLNTRRLILNATSSVVSANVVLKLQPYITITGTTYNPDPAAGGVGNTFSNNGGGVYSLLLNGVPEPACGNVNGNLAPCPTLSLDVKSNLTGEKSFALTDIRQ